MSRELLLQEAAKSIGGWIGVLRLPHGKQTIRVHHLQEHWDLTSRGGDHSREEKTGGLIRHHYAGTRCQSGQQSFARIWPRLNVRIVENVRALNPTGILRHTVDHETVHPIARPRIVAAQRFHDKQWFL